MQHARGSVALLQCAAACLQRSPAWLAAAADRACLLHVLAPGAREGSWSAGFRGRGPQGDACAAPAAAPGSPLAPGGWVLLQARSVTVVKAGGGQRPPGAGAAPAKGRGAPAAAAAPKRADGKVLNEAIKAPHLRLVFPDGADHALLLTTRPPGALFRASRAHENGGGVNACC